MSRQVRTDTQRAHPRTLSHAAHYIYNGGAFRTHPWLQDAMRHMVQNHIFLTLNTLGSDLK